MIVSHLDNVVAGPISRPERTGSIDVLRGFALLGVVLANLISFVTFVMPESVVTRATSGGMNHTYHWLFVTFIDNKFITLFSLLFGYGFGVITERLRAKAKSPRRFYLRRMLILLLAGFIHVFFWWGEILHTYALCGLVMILFINASDKTLLGWAAFFMLAAPLVVRYFMITTKAFDPALSEPVYSRYLETALRTDLLSVLQANWDLHHYVYITCLAEWTDLFQALSKFLIGYWILRKQFLIDVSIHQDTIRKCLAVCSVIAVAYALETSWMYYTHPSITHLALRFLLYDFNRIGVLSMSITYGCLLVLWFHNQPASIILNGFRSVGMMSLSNYLMHTVLYIVLLHGIGFGLMDKLTAIDSLWIGLSIYFAQVLVSKQWLRQYRFGPAEWIWRQLSYAQRIPIRVNNRQSTLP